MLERLRQYVSYARLSKHLGQQVTQLRSTIERVVRGLFVRFDQNFCLGVCKSLGEPRLKVKDENVGWKHTCSGRSHAGFERIGSRSGYNPVQDIYILQRPSSCDPHFRYSEFLFVRRAAIYGFAVLRQLESGNTTLRVRSVISVELCRSDTGWESSSGVRCFGGSICRHVSISNPSSGGHDRSNPADIVAAGRGHSHRRHYVGGQTSPVNVTSIMFPVKLTLR